MHKIAVVVMGQDCSRFLSACLGQVQDAEKIFYLDGGSKDDSCLIAESYNATVWHNKYDKKDPEMNGKQRNFYLEKLKKELDDEWWVLCLDADEILEDNGMVKIKNFIDFNNGGVYSPRIRHFIYNLGYEDNTVPIHYVLGRFFKMGFVESYPLVEHPVIKSKDCIPSVCNEFVIWHLGYVSGVFDVFEKFRQHSLKSNMHSPEFLHGWLKAHVFGRYPVRPVDPRDIPSVLFSIFTFDKSEFYYEGYKMEGKYWQDALDWKEYFNPESVLLLGCGLGHRVFCLNKLGIKAKGFDNDSWAVKNCVAEGLIELKDLGKIDENNEKHDLVVAYDVLEHLSKDQLMTALVNISNYCTKYLLVSVPCKGNPNLNDDPTHKIKESRDWWIRRIENAGFINKKVPDHFLFKYQLLLFEVKNDA